MFAYSLHIGEKTWTSRTRKYGTTGDRFEAFGAVFELIEITKLRLGMVVHHYREEGCDSKEHFVEVWRQIHPREGFDPDQEVWVHKFHRVLGA